MRVSLRPERFHGDVETDERALIDQLKYFLVAQIEVAHGGIHIAQRTLPAAGPARNTAQIQLGLN